jgi:hypothetical protein
MNFRAHLNLVSNLNIKYPMKNIMIVNGNTLNQKSSVWCKNAVFSPRVKYVVGVCYVGLDVSNYLYDILNV